MEPLGPQPSVGGHPHRVLVIDDSSLIREAVRLALRDDDVLTAESAEEGIATAARDRPDAILLDVVLPGMDGPTAAKALAADAATAAIPVILLTGSETAMRTPAPVRGVIGKPFEIGSLASELDALLGWAA